MVDFEILTSLCPCVSVLSSVSDHLCLMFCSIYFFCLTCSSSAFSKPISLTFTAPPPAPKQDETQSSYQRLKSQSPDVVPLKDTSSVCLICTVSLVLWAKCTAQHRSYNLMSLNWADKRMARE